MTIRCSAFVQQSDSLVRVTCCYFVALSVYKAPPPFSVSLFFLLSSSIVYLHNRGKTIDDDAEIGSHVSLDLHVDNHHVYYQNSVTLRRRTSSISTHSGSQAVWLHLILCYSFSMLLSRVFYGSYFDPCALWYV